PWTRPTPNRRICRQARGYFSVALDYPLLAAFALLWLSIVPTPGPNTLLIVHLALTAGWRKVALALLGNLFAIVVTSLFLLMGISLVLAAKPPLRFLLHLIGGGYLVVSGLQLMRAGQVHQGQDLSLSTPSAPRALGSGRSGGPFAQGVLTALANVPALFFLA